MHMRLSTLNFDELRKCYQEDPAAFELLRQRLLDEAVAAAPAEHRRALQQTRNSIEEARRAASSPLEAAMVASRMMLASWGRLQDALSELQQEAASMQTTIVLERIKKL